MSDSLSIPRLVRRLLLVVVAMFAFGFALVPIYDVMCQAFGINGKTAGAYEGAQTADEAREVRVQFLATNASGMVWEFKPVADQLSVHPGSSREMRFIVDRDLPADVRHLTLAYTLFDITSRQPPVAVVDQASLVAAKESLQ